MNQRPFNAHTPRRITWPTTRASWPSRGWNHGPESHTPWPSHGKTAILLYRGRDNLSRAENGENLHLLCATLHVLDEFTIMDVFMQRISFALLSYRVHSHPLGFISLISYAWFTVHCAFFPSVRASSDMIIKYVTREDHRIVSAIIFNTLTFYGV